ncbi:hypothetical protein [Marinobacterium stanieri]|uniref:Uncharacterized protein n=1 Tax=Marinobacterium stanieri TaxID=49186 RepID=A0A1N6W618_9GAMM|nr:hypothetical protein [Marinobacterium stanieri]SIQ85593.1 hypothetical protein SAMN05421647_1105 [Marinobacterium stanieri]
MKAFSRGMKIALELCTQRLKQGKALPERITTDPAGFNLFQLGFVFGIDLAHHLMATAEGREV